MSQREETEEKREKWRERVEEIKVERQRGQIWEERHTRDRWEETENRKRERKLGARKENESAKETRSAKGIQERNSKSVKKPGAREPSVSL